MVASQYLVLHHDLAPLPLVAGADMSLDTTIVIAVDRVDEEYLLQETHTGRTHALVRLFDEPMIAYRLEEGPQAMNVAELAIADVQGLEATLFGQAVHVQDQYRPGLGLGRDHDQLLIHLVLATHVAELAVALLAAEGEATAGMISGIAGLDPQGTRCINVIILWTTQIKSLQKSSM